MVDVQVLLVVDEADRMMAAGMGDQLRTLMGQVRPDAQKALFTATLPSSIESAAQNWLGDSFSSVRVGDPMGHVQTDATARRTKPRAAAESRPECEPAAAALPKGCPETLNLTGACADDAVGESLLAVSRAVAQTVQVKWLLQ